MATSVRPFLMFEGRAEEAMRFYVSLFEGAQVGEIKRHPDGKVMLGTFTIAGQTVLCTDSPIKHTFTFTRQRPLRRVVAAEPSVTSRGTSCAGARQGVSPGPRIAATSDEGP